MQARLTRRVSALAGRALAIAAGLFVLAVPAAAKVTLVHWQHHSPARKALVEQFAQQFMKANPNVVIQVESIPYGDYFKKLLPALAAGSGPHTFQIAAGEVPAFVAAGVAQPLAASVISGEAIESQLVPATIAHFKLDGQYYALPTDVQTIVLFRNPELFKQAGLDPNRPPATWDEAVQAASRIHRRDAQGQTTQMGIATGGYGPVLHTLMLQAGASLWDSAAGKPVFDSPEARKGMQFAVDLVARYGVEDPKFGSRWTAFRQSKLGMVWAHPAMVGSFRATVPDLRFETSEVPAAAPGGSRTSLLTSWAYVVSTRAKSKAEMEAATRWVVYLTSADAQRRWTVETGELPAHRELLANPELRSDRVLWAGLDSLTSAVATPWRSRSITEELPHKAYQMMLLEGKTADVALRWLQGEAIKAELEQREKEQM